MNHNLELYPPKGAHFLKEQLALYENQPKTPEVIPGILLNSFGFVYGPSKAGKSILVENMFLTICSGKSDFLGYPIQFDGIPKCLFISLEERPNRRNERNLDQLRQFSSEERELIGSNYVTSNSDLPPYLMNASDWEMVYDLISYYSPSFVCIDSVSRLTARSIADEEVSKDICRKLRKISDELNTTLLVINHIPKRGNENGLDIFSMSGSRIYGQEADFLIGVNRLPNGVRYVKKTASRYSSDDDNVNVDCIKINDNKVVEFVEKKPELQLLRQNDLRRDDTNLIRLKDEISKHALQSEDGKFFSSQITHLYRDKIMSKETLYRNLKVLQEERIIEAGKNGEYKWIAND